MKMITDAGLACKLIVRPGFNADAAPPGVEVVEVDPGKIGDNTVEVTDRSGFEIAHLTEQLTHILEDVSVVLTHDLIYAANLWKYHVACRRIARERNDLHWYHWVHSATDLGVANQVKQFRGELAGRFPRSTLIVMHEEEMIRKQVGFGYDRHSTAIVPNPIDFTADYHPAALEAIERASLWDADVIAVYPCRLDRGKQPHILIEIFAKLCEMGWNAWAVIVDFHSTHDGSSTGGDKAIYRDEMKLQARDLGANVLFTSDLEYPSANYHIPHKAVMDLFEFADMLVHPSVSESDPLILPEAAWKRCGLMLNYDLPVFRLYQGNALMYRFTSGIDVTTGLVGSTATTYDNRDAYMGSAAAAIADLMTNDAVLSMHAQVRKARNLYTIWTRYLWPLVNKHGPLATIEETTREPHGLTSIIVPCWLTGAKDNEVWGYTKACVDSVVEHLDTYELILVDNGSTVGQEWMKQVADTYIRNEENRGYGPAVNQGLAAASGDWLLVINNDIEFVHDWITKAVDAWDERTGIVSSHNLAHDPDRKVGRELPPDPAGYFFGACWMISREVYEKVGGLDEQYEMGMFEDKSYTKTIVSEGYQAIKIGHVKHVGNASWGKLPNHQEIYARNKERYEQRWGK
jgi:glycosyltransferase involved in cell wall biosynthesis